MTPTASELTQEDSGGSLGRVLASKSLLRKVWYLNFSRASLSPVRILVAIWMLVLVAAGIFIHPVAWFFLGISALGLGFSFLLNVGTEAGENWAKALYGDDPESKNHWSRKQR
jgi:hypothetical protein